MHAIGPETGDFHQHFQAFAGQIAFIAGVVGVVVNRIGYRAVAVDFFKRDFPFVVAFDAGKSHHRVKRAGQPLLARVVLRLRQLVVPVFEQVFGNLRLGQRKIKRHSIGFGVPISGAAVFFAGKAFGADIEAGVFAVIS